MLDIVKIVILGVMMAGLLVGVVNVWNYWFKLGRVVASSINEVQLLKVKLGNTGLSDREKKEEIIISLLDRVNLLTDGLGYLSYLTSYSMSAVFCAIVLLVIYLK